ncbi:DUF1304 domain-containing protein [Microbacterium sp. bgisy207]|uniref:DUF1304 domain-containing protein n=1 Tax=Microbacterium sp. bgisy207 TaxID=3413800 RepID=UPI003EBE32B7
MVVGIIASVLAALAAVLHVWIFAMESISWRSPRVWRRFGVRDQQSAETLRPMAYNQGFYNLFLAIGALLGVTLFWAASPVAGLALALFSLGSMVAAAIVLATGGARYLRPAAVQGTLPLLAGIAFLFA